MDKNTHKWREKFHNNSLEGESWLTPKDETYLSFKEGIAKKNKRRKPVFLFWLLGSVSLVGLLIIFNPVSNKNSIAEKTTTSVDANQIFEATKTEPLGKPITTNQGLEEITFDDASTDSNVESKEVYQTEIEVSRDISTTKFSDYTKGISRQRINSAIIEKRSSPGSFAVSENTFTKAAGFPILPLLASLNKPSILVEAKQRYIKEPFSEYEIAETSKRGYWSIFSTFGYSELGFTLNDHYLAALDPADFYFEGGRGYNVGLGIKLHLNEKNAFGVSLNYENIESTSGHNSTLNYDEFNEIEMANQMSIVMASPIGFVESDLLVNRSSGSSGEMLNVQLETKHIIKTIGLRLDYSRRILAIKDFSLNASANFQTNYLLNLSNNFVKAEVEQSGFFTSNKSISASQSNVRKFIPMAGLAMEAKYSLRQNLDLKLIGSYSKSLIPLYKELDFETNISQSQVVLSLAKRI